ncbi:MAG: restriction endonuclease subunit S [Dehalococcoidia bacterium]
MVNGTTPLNLRLRDHVNYGRILRYGKSLIAAKRSASGTVPVYGSNGIVGRHSEAVTSGPTIIVGRKGSVGEVHFTADPCWPIDTTYYAEAAVTGELRFFYYLLKSLELGDLDRSTAIPGLSRSDYDPLRVALPPLAEQRRIVAALDAAFARLDAVSARLARVPVLVKRYRAAVLAAAVKGRLTEDWRAANPDAEPAAVLLDRILAERRARWEAEQQAKYTRAGKTPPFGWREKYEEPAAPDADGLPELPETWAWADADAVAEAIVDCPHTTPKWTQSGRLCIRTTEFRPGRLDLSEVRYVSEQTYRERVERLTPMPGDLLYSREGGILGVACLIPFGVEICMGQRMMLLRTSKGVMPEYTMHLLNSQMTLTRVRSMTGGTAAPHLNVRDVKAFPVPLPPLAEQQEIVRRVEQQMRLAEAIEGRLARVTGHIARLRQALLAKAFRGELVGQATDG